MGLELDMMLIALSVTISCQNYCPIVFVVHAIAFHSLWKGRQYSFSR